MTTTNRSAMAQIRLRTRNEEQAGASLSGNERDHLFLNAGGKAFTDIAGVAGLDDPADGRSSGILDYDRDGWPDLALVNSNAPMFELYHNEIGRYPGAAGRGRMVALRFVGGNHSPSPNPTWSARDGYGARVTVDLGDLRLVREHRAGEGFAAQNSATLLIGIGDHDAARSIKVRWPSGRTQTAEAVSAGTLVVVYENPAQSPSGEAFVREPYVRPARAPSGTVAARPSPRRRFPVSAGPRAGASALRLYTTMATWCGSCKTELPHLGRLRAAFPAGDLSMFGVPIDTNDTSAAIKAWAATHKPVYDVLTALSPDQVASVKAFVLDQLKVDAVPASIVTDADGRVLLTQWGPPSVSRLRELLAGQRSERRADGRTP